MNPDLRLLVALLAFAPAAWAADPPPAASAADAAPPAAEATPVAPPAVKSVTRSSPTMDRLELDPTAITGNRELPKVLYIVPWRHSDLGDITGKPPKSLLDEVLEPVDRDVFLRENRYYDALKPGAAAEKPGTAQSSEGKP